MSWQNDVDTKHYVPAFIEIGVALTTFGGLFMLLGVMLFFDGALLALGNVRSILLLSIAYTYLSTSASNAR